MKPQLLALLTFVGVNLHAAERTILFVDDHDILYRAGTRRVLNPPVRHADNPLITDLPPGRYHLRLHLQKAEAFAVTLR